jgi:hypothetical protein
VATGAAVDDHRRSGGLVGGTESTPGRSAHATSLRSPVE